MDDLQIEKLLEKYTLQNILKFGKASEGAIIGKIVRELDDRSKIPKIRAKLSPMIDKLSKLDKEEIRKRLEKSAPELLEKKIHKEKGIFAFLKIKEGSKVVTAFPPGAEKYPHIGHAKALLLNYLLAKKFDGKFKLRFEDTNPKLAKKEFYEIMIDNFRWLGVEWDELDYASDHMELYYEHAKKLIEAGKAYMCFCDGKAIRLSRNKGVACRCRSKSIEQNLTEWDEFESYPERKAVLRLKIDLEHKNTTMRDPTIFRVIKAKHARQGDKYSVWPNYDFQTSIMDGLQGITHRLRSKEFEMRNELQRYLQKEMGYDITSIYEFGRFRLEGVSTSGRAIREMLDAGKIIGWDDPSLTTLVALRRRGFLPKAIKNFVVSTGITKNDTVLTWDDLIIHNRRLLDKSANRFFIVDKPVKITIEDAPRLNIKLKLHPDFPDNRTRDFNTWKEFFVAKKDIDAFSDGDIIRLMDCLNFKVISAKDKRYVFDSIEHKEFKEKGKRIIHYVPVDHAIDVSVLMPDKTLKECVGENHLRDVSVGDVIQAERFGFVRLDSVSEKTRLKFWYTHK